MFPWKYVRSLFKVGVRAKLVLILLTVMTPFIFIIMAKGTDRFPQSGTNSRGLLGTEFEQKRNGRQGRQHDTSLDQMVEDRFASRRQHLKEQCAIQDKYYFAQNSENAVKEHLTIDKSHRLVYCAIEKIGCTFWKRVFQILSGFRNVTDPFQIQGIRAYEGYLTAKNMPFDKIHVILKASKTFMFVREPFERLLSGYVDKLFAPNAAYWSFLGTYIATKFRNETSASRCGHDVTFEEFVRYFLYSQTSYEKRDAHFVPNFEHCRPCELDYDYIGKLETFEEDTLFLLKKLKLEKEIKFDNFQKETEKDAILDAADYVFSMKNAIRKCMTTTEALYRAYRKLQIRGILSKEIPFPFPRDSTREIGITEYKEALLKVHVHSGSPAGRKSNRLEAFKEAYATLSQETLLKLSEELSVDSQIFGYEKIPSVLKDIGSYKPAFKYFSL